MSVSMTSLTRWVLAHKRIVVGFWLVLTLVGIVSAGPATKALKQKFTVPGRDGYETNVQIAKRYSGTGGEHAPLLPVVTLPAGKTVDSPGVRPSLRQSQSARASHDARSICRRTVIPSAVSYQTYLSPWLLRYIFR